MSRVARSSFLFSGLIEAAVALGLAAADRAAATSFTWTGPGGTVDEPKTGMWNAAANWREQQVPTSEGATRLVFRPGTAAYTATNNIQMAPFVLNSLFAITRGDRSTTPRATGTTSRCAPRARRPCRCPGPSGCSCSASRP